MTGPFSDVQQRWDRLTGRPTVSRLPEGEKTNAALIHFCHTSVGADCNRQRKESARVGYSHLPTSETAEDRQQSPGRHLQEAGDHGQGLSSCQFVGRSGCGNQGLHEWRQESGGFAAGCPGNTETRRKADGTCADTSPHSAPLPGSSSPGISPSRAGSCCRTSFNPNRDADNSASS